MSILNDGLSWIGDHVTGPVLNPVLGIGNLDPTQKNNVGGVNLLTGERALTAGGETQPAGPPGVFATFSPTTTGFSHWALGFVVVAAVLLVSDEDDTWAPVARGFAWLAVVGLIFTQWSKLTSSAQQVWK